MSNFLMKTFFYLGSSENSNNIYPLSHMSMFPSSTVTKNNNARNGSEHQSFFHDDFNFSRLSTMARW